MTRLPLLSKDEMKAMDKLKAHYGGAKKIMKDVEKQRDLEVRRAILKQKGFDSLIGQAVELAKKLPEAGDYIKANNLKTKKKSVATTQVSAWQGAKVTLDCLKRAAADGTVFMPKEMISVMALNDDYIYNGDLLATMAICENILGAKFCNTSFVGTPLPAHRFETISKLTGAKFETYDAGNGMRALVMKNQGTAFGNLCGVEVGNDNHLVYLDTVTRTALATGGDFFLNPSWSTIAAACYYGRDLKNIHFKVSVFLSVQNLIQFRMLLNIIKEYLRADKTSPIREINMGNAISPEKFVAAHKILKASGIKGVSLTAHIRINTDLGMKEFSWYNNACSVLDSGCDMTLKYESDGQCAADDTIMSYFLPKEDREAKAEVLGDVLFHKVLRCDQDAKNLLKSGYKVAFADISQK